MLITVSSWTLLHLMSACLAKFILILYKQTIPLSSRVYRALHACSVEHVIDSFVPIKIRYPYYCNFIYSVAVLILLVCSSTVFKYRYFNWYAPMVFFSLTRLRNFVAFLFRFQIWKGFLYLYFHVQLGNVSYIRLF